CAAWDDSLSGYIV
nr:immunoglobulin light chain junction region [Macaca mulatta]MPO06538.1 immunoglobulin light chain junction region [Macaca mulatta]MPO07373.1 immunoglobulin light chain junction region [Macaca mulatta]MPO10321.1 immunoglobulin light chain junction region [Macaca mulatta]MPO10624.1 immunoglobulin light chain junction region [Macaca mulatta]